MLIIASFLSVLINSYITFTVSIAPVAPIGCPMEIPSLEDLERRPALKQLLDKGVFRYAAVLSGREQGKVQTLRRVVP